MIKLAIVTDTNCVLCELRNMKTLFSKKYLCPLPIRIEFWLHNTKVCESKSGQYLSYNAYGSFTQYQNSVSRMFSHR
jgi:hypothetical protein